MTLHLAIPVQHLVAGVIAFALAYAYARLVVKRNYHPATGQFWSQHSWLEVVVGTLAINTTTLVFAGFSAGLAFAMLAADAIWGAPMICAVLDAQAEKHARAEDEQIARGA